MLIKIIWYLRDNLGRGQRAKVIKVKWEQCPPHPAVLLLLYSPVLHAGVAPDGLLHVGMALRGLAGPGPLPGLD